MAEGARVATSVTTLIDLSVKAATHCFEYTAAVGKARDDIKCLQRQINNLHTCLEKVQNLLDDQSQNAFKTSQALVDSLEACRSELAQVQKRLDPGKTRKVMRRIGLRALKWPLSSKEVCKIVSNLERHNQTILVCLQVDQTWVDASAERLVEPADTITEQFCSIYNRNARICRYNPAEKDQQLALPASAFHLTEIPTLLIGRILLHGSEDNTRAPQVAWPLSAWVDLGMGYCMNWLLRPRSLTDQSKSQVAIQFAHHVHNEYPQTSVYWVHASSKSRFEAVYRSIAEKLELPRRNDPGIDVCGLVCDWLQTEEAGPWLMVLDNADDANLFHSTKTKGDKSEIELTKDNGAAESGQQPLAVYLPKRCNGTILITSRSMDAAEKLTGSHKDIYRVTTMDEAQCLQIFQKKLNGGFDENTATDLLRALSCIPLAITQAAAYINRRAPRASVKTYLDTIRESDKRKDNLLNRDSGDLRRDETVSNSVVTTWQVTFEQIRRERPSAAKLLSFMSHFNPQGIPEFMLRHYHTDLMDYADRDMESDCFEDDLDILRGYSLVSVTAPGDVFEMHALVQFCTRAWITRVDNAERWRQVFLRSMSRYFPSGNSETWSACQVLLPHVESLSKEEPPSEDFESWVYLLDNCVWYMFSIGNYREAEDLARKLVETRTKILGNEHLDTLSSMAGLGTIYRMLGQWKEAEELQMQLMELYRRVLGEEHPDMLRSANNLALTYSSQGRWKEAEELQIRSIEAYRRVLGDDHPDILRSMSDLALTYLSQGRWKEAEELQIQLMEVSRRVPGDGHLDILRSMNNLALMYSSQGRWKEAEELQMRLLEKYRRVPGDDHPDILRSMNNLALTYSSQARWKEAEELEARLIEIRRRVLGDEHPDTLSNMASLAIIHSEQGRWKEAEELSMRVMEVQKRVLGDEHPCTLRTMSNLATTYGYSGRFEEEEELNIGVMEVQKRVLGEEHPSTLKTASNLVFTYCDQGQWNDATELGVRVLEMGKRIRGEEHPATLDTMAAMARVYKGQGRLKEAEELGIQVLEANKKVLGEEHPQTLESMHYLAITWKDQGRAENALGLMRSCAVLRQRVLGTNHPHAKSSVALAKWERMSNL